MAAVAREDFAHRFGRNIALAGVDGDEDPAVVDPAFIIACVVVTDAVVLSRPVRPPATAPARADRGCPGNGGACNCAGRSQGANAGDRQSGDAEDGPDPAPPSAPLTVSPMPSSACSPEPSVTVVPSPSRPMSESLPLSILGCAAR